MNIGVKDLTATIVGGTGEATTTTVAGGEIYGLLCYVGINAPDGASYIISVYDRDGYLLYTEDTISGDGYIEMERPVNSTLRVVVSDATVDGTYAIRLRYTY